MKNIKTYEQYKGITFRKFMETYYSHEIPTLKTVSCDSRDIVDLDGIEEFVDLSVLWCHNNKISSLKSLENSIKLIELYCWGNEITSLKGIENLPKIDSIFCEKNPIDWVDYVDKKGNTWYIELPKSIKFFQSDKFNNIKQYWKFMDENQPALVSRKFNF